MARTDTDPITIVIADDHRSFGEAMQIALDREQDLDVIQVVGDGDLAVTATLETPEGYRFTAFSAVASVERVLQGTVPPGAWTPSRAFGADFVAGLPGVLAGELRTT